MTSARVINLRKGAEASQLFIDANQLLDIMRFLKFVLIGIVISAVFARRAMYQIGPNLSLDLCLTAAFWVIVLIKWALYQRICNVYGALKTMLDQEEAVRFRYPEGFKEQLRGLAFSIYTFLPLDIGVCLYPLWKLIDLEGGLADLVLWGSTTPIIALHLYDGYLRTEMVGGD